MFGLEKRGKFVKPRLVASQHNMASQPTPHNVSTPEIRVSELQTLHVAKTGRIISVNKIGDCLGSPGYVSWFTTIWDTRFFEGYSGTRTKSSPGREHQPLLPRWLTSTVGVSYIMLPLLVVERALRHRIDGFVEGGKGKM